MHIYIKVKEEKINKDTGIGSRLHWSFLTLSVWNVHHIFHDMFTVPHKREV